MNTGAGDNAGRGTPSLRLLAIAAIVAVRLVALDADPPPWLSWSTGLYTDEGFYTLDARHAALWGSWAPGNFHDRLLSPLLSVLLQGVFTLFGAGLVSARLLSVTFGLGTVFVFRLGLRRLWGIATADWGTLFLGLAPPFALYNRLALQETPTVFWLVLSFTLWAYGRAGEDPQRRALLLGLAGASFGIALTVKALAIMALPAFVWAWILPSPFPRLGYWGKGEGGEPQRAGRGLLGFGLVLAVYAMFWYAPHHAELTRMGAYYRAHQYQPHSGRTVWLNIRRGVIGGERGVFPYLLAFLPIPVLLAGWGMARRSDAVTKVLLCWLLGDLAFCLLSTYAPDRYYVLFLPALAGLAACGAARLGRPWQLASVALFLTTCGIWYGLAWTGRTYDRRDTAQRLTHLLPPGSILVGNDAPALCLDTAFAAAPVQPGLSNDDHPVERLHANFVLVTRAPSWQEWWHSHYPNIVQPSHRVTTISQGGFRHYVVDIYAVGPKGP